ncbi:MAG: redox-regulated ATPase YchF [Dehalococcoidia bacterium]|nr:redox-regulated ATPase YchF [Dehalococcoidia bacterium]
MELGIIGLPKSGKTTIFNALTRGRAETSSYTTGMIAPNLGMVKVPDERLEGLSRLFKPQKTTPAEVRYVDIGAPPKGFGKGEGISGEFLTHISRADALIHVVRVFEDAGVPHVNETIDPQRDIESMEMELAFSDMAIIERKMERIKDSLKSAKAHDRDVAQKEMALLERVKSALEKGTPIRQQGLTEPEDRALANYRFLTAKPVLLLLNIGESQLDRAEALEADFRGRLKNETCDVAALCGKLEMELAQMDDAEAQVFRQDMGIGEAGLARVVALSYKLLGFISFFTVGEDEVKAWTIREGTVAQKAAGKIHTDLERGFIRAEVIGQDDLVKMGGLAPARQKGLIRLEGKTYVVKDGDVMTILFNI